MEIENFKWFLVYTKAREEERAQKNLENQGFETFLPMIAYEKISQPKSFSLKPMFPRYLFITINIERDNWHLIKSTRGVSHVVLFGNKFAAVPNGVIEFIKTRVNSHSIVKQKITKHLFQKGDKLVINKGIFQGKEATFFSKTGKERVKILLTLMNELIMAELPENDIGIKKIIETFKL
jgi:transcriptional antiterminator RfaH